MPEKSSARVGAAAAATAEAPQQQQKQQAPADRSIVSAVLVVGGGTARLLAEAGSSLASSFAGAEAEAIGSDLLRRPRGRAIKARQSADRMCVFLLIVFARTPNPAKKYQKIEQQNPMVRHSRNNTRPTTNQQINVRTLSCSDA